MGRGLLAVVIVGVTYVYGRERSYFHFQSIWKETAFVWPSRFVSYDVEHHSAEHLLSLLVGEPRTSHYSEHLFVGVSPEEPVIEVRDVAEHLHVYLCPGYPVELLCQEMSSSVIFNQNAFHHVDSIFRYGISRNPLRHTFP